MKVPKDFPMFCMGPLPDSPYVAVGRRIEALPGWQWQEGMHVLTAGGLWLLDSEDCEPDGWAHKAGFPPYACSVGVINWLQLRWYRAAAGLPGAAWADLISYDLASGLPFFELEKLVADLESFAASGGS